MDTKITINNIKSIMHSVQRKQPIWITIPTSTFENDFIKLKQLGNAGGYGITFQCRRKSDRSIVAVKQINKNRVYKLPAKYRLRYIQNLINEITILQSLNHKNIIKLIDVCEDKTFLYLIMEECKGGELFERLAEKGRYNEKDAARIIKEILTALQYMHDDNGILHSDLKPENIMFSEDTENSPIKIIDFGLSKVLPRLKYLSTRNGSPFYIAPEVIRGRKYNHACDLWSVGVILFVMIYGYPPFYVNDCDGDHEALYEKIKQGFIPKVRSTAKYGNGQWFPDHIKTSTEVKDLISKLLQSQIRKRYTAKEALTHPWIVNMNNDNDFEKYIMGRVIECGQLSSFNKIIAKIFQLQFYKMRPEHYRQLKQLFDKYDRNKDELLSFNEFENAIKNIGMNINNKQLQIIYKQFDASESKNAGIRFNDLLNALVYDYLACCDYRLHDAFTKLDTDKDGKISVKQLKQQMEHFDILDKWDKDFEIIEQQMIDTNGVIDYGIFLLNMHPYFDEQSI